MQIKYVDLVEGKNEPWITKCANKTKRAYLHSYDNAVVSCRKAGTVLKTKVSGLKT